MQRTRILAAKLKTVIALVGILTATATFKVNAQQGSEAKAFPEKHPDPPQEIRLLNFAGGFNLPLWITQRQGYFAGEKIDVKIDFTPGSTYQLTHLIAGTYDMGFTAIDNVVAYREGQNEAYLPPGTVVDLIAVLASDDASPAGDSSCLTSRRVGNNVIWYRPPRYMRPTTAQRELPRSRRRASSRCNRHR